MDHAFGGWCQTCFTPNIVAIYWCEWQYFTIISNVVNSLLHEMKGLKVVDHYENTMCIWAITSIYTSKIICPLLLPRLNYSFQSMAHFLPIICFQKFSEFIMYNCWNMFFLNSIINNIILSTNIFIHHTQQSIISLQVWKINVA